MSRRCLCKPPRAEAASSSSVAEKPRRPGLPSRRSGRRASARPRALPRPGFELPGAGKQPRRLLPGRAEPRRQGEPPRALPRPRRQLPGAGGAAQAKASRRGPCRGRAACCRARGRSRAGQGEPPRALPRPRRLLPGAGEQPRRLLPGRASRAGQGEAPRALPRPRRLLPGRSTRAGPSTRRATLMEDDEAASASAHGRRRRTVLRLQTTTSEHLAVGKGGAQADGPLCCRLGSRAPAVRPYRMGRRRESE
jgi:hypothetical protein